MSNGGCYSNNSNGSQYYNSCNNYDYHLMDMEAKGVSKKLSGESGELQRIYDYIVNQV